MILTLGERNGPGPLALTFESDRRIYCLGFRVGLDPAWCTGQSSLGLRRRSFQHLQGVLFFGNGPKNPNKRLLGLFGVSGFGFSGVGGSGALPAPNIPLRLASLSLKPWWRMSRMRAGFVP